ncbi:MAG: MotA/TolQ/ExbB proton channel family protein [Spirochaetes bacterium]|nr:MotA/TolQ/ExbB proton channel family protein [Spirochaetota bacterium]
MKKLIVCLIILFSTLPLFADEEADLKRDYEKIEKELEIAETEFWKKKYALIELKQKVKEEIGDLETDYNELIKNRSALKEEILSIEVDNKSLGEKKDNYNLRISEIYSIYLKSLDELTLFAKRNGPFTQQKDLLILQDIRNGVEKKQGIIKSGEELIDFLNSKIEDSRECTVVHSDIITKDRSVEKGRKLRLGYIFNGYVTDSGNHAGMVLRTGKITQNAFAWHEDLSSSQADMIKDTVFGISSNKEIAFLPLDVMQSKAVGKTYATKGSFIKEIAEWFKSGGIVMYAIVFVLAYAIFIMINRIIVFRKNRGDASCLMESLQDLIEKKDFDVAVQLCESENSPLTRLMKEILKDRKLSREDVELKIQEIILHEIPVIEKHLPTLKSLGALAPLLGLLGTVTGMISLFDVITVFGTGDPKLLAGGIAEALVTTEFGLIVAIPSVLFHRVLLNYAEKIINDLERFSLTVLNTGWNSKKN